MKLPKGTKKAVQKYLYAHYSREASHKIIENTECLFNDFIKEAPASGGLNFLRKPYYGGLSVFAFYEVIRDNVSEEVLQDILWSMLLNGGDINKRIKIPINMNNSFVQKISYYVIKKYGEFADKKIDSGKWKNAWRIKANPYNKRNGVSTSLYGCPVAKFAKSHGYEHLMPLFCGSDFKVAEKYGLKLIRKHTKAEGYQDCDFWYLNEESEEI